MSSSYSKHCAFCSKGNPSRVCAGCNSAPGPADNAVVTTSYCDATCQKADWNAHKSMCKAHQLRKVLYRAGETAQMAFYMFREKTFDQNIERVDKKENCLFLYEGYYDNHKIIIPFQIIIPFPHHLLQDERDKQAALTFLTCGDAIAYIHGLFTTTLKGQSSVSSSFIFTFV